MPKIFSYLFVPLFVFFLAGCQFGGKNEKINSFLEENSLEDTLEASLRDRDTILYEDANHLEYDPKTTVFFNHAFIFRYKTEDEDWDEFWIYHNPETGNMMYNPGDPMIEAVICDPKGNYYFFGTDVHGERTAVSQKVEWVTEGYPDTEKYPQSDQYVSFKKTGKTHKLESNDPPFIAEEYKWEFQKLQGDQTTAVAEINGVNVYQIYGFNKLEGDIQLPVNYYDFIGIFGRNQLVTRLKSGETTVELLSYEYNPAFFEAGDYVYSVNQGEGNWKKTHLPILEK